MRLLMINLLAAALVLFSASFASAYGLNLVSASDGNTTTGDIVSYDIFLDIPVNDGLVLFSVSLTYDPTVVTYRDDLSAAEDYYPLYAPATSGKDPATYLVPFANPPGTWPAPPAGLSQVNVDFGEANLNPSVGTATGLYLGTLAFEVTGTGISNMNWSFDNGGNTFNVGAGLVNIAGDVAMTNTTPTITNVIPEPTTALLVGLGMVGLGVAGRRRA